MSHAAVSIIMPIYNAADFLKESLGSALQQTLKEIEIICVNDGSKDQSLEIIKQYAAYDGRIKIIDKENSGYGHSMNIGLQIATGEYIGILEPDDFADANMYEFLFQTAQKQNADVVKSNYYEYRQKKKEDTFFEVLRGQEYNVVTSAETDEYLVFMRPCIWSAIYRRDFLIQNHIQFNETPGASYQDTAFSFKVWMCAQRVVFVKEGFLHYRIDNENSSVNSSDKIFSICDEFNSIQSFLNSNKLKKDKFSKILQVLKFDSYMWNLERISDDYKNYFTDQIALEFLKAENEKILCRDYFDEIRWEQIQNILASYKERRGGEAANYNYTLLKQRVYDLENSHSYKVGHALMILPAAIKRTVITFRNGRNQ